MGRRSPQDARLLAMLSMSGAVVGALGVAALMSQTVANVATRSVIGTPIGGTIEAVTYWWMALIALLPLAAAGYRREHIGAPVVYERLGRSGKAWLDVIADAVTVAMTTIVIFGAMPAALDSWHIRESVGASDLSIWPLRFVVPLAFAMWAVVCLWRLVALVVSMRPLDRAGVRARRDGDAVS